MSTGAAVLPSPASWPAGFPARVRGRLRQLRIDTGYVLAGFPVALSGFVLVVAGLSLGTALLVVWVGLVVLPATLLIARGHATVERAWLPAVLGRPLPAPVYRRAGPGARPLTRLTTPLRDPQY